MRYQLTIIFKGISYEGMSYDFKTKKETEKYKDIIDNTVDYAFVYDRVNKKSDVWKGCS